MIVQIFHNHVIDFVEGESAFKIQKFNKFLKIFKIFYLNPSYKEKDGMIYVWIGRSVLCTLFWIKISSPIHNTFAVATALSPGLHYGIQV